MMIKYLKLIISEGKICMDPVKVAGVTDWPTLTSKKEVQSFLRFMNFYQRFIEDFSTPCETTFQAHEKDCKREQGISEQFTFYEIKNQDMSSPILCFADDSKAFCIEADSSDYATGSVLSQQSSDDLKWHPITFYLKLLNMVE
jgi:RNase H-like domain found in reverse transcriptase